MINVIFRNLEDSEFVRQKTLERVQTTIDKFPDVGTHHVTVTLSMENSPTHAGQDVFTVKIHMIGKRYKNLILEKSDSNLYKALADVIDHALERLNRFGDKNRVKRRSEKRKFLVENMADTI